MTKLFSLESFLKMKLRNVNIDWKFTNCGKDTDPMTIKKADIDV
jgi:hypothetical protein